MITCVRKVTWPHPPLKARAKQRLQVQFMNFVENKPCRSMRQKKLERFGWNGLFSRIIKEGHGTSIRVHGLTANKALMQKKVR